MKMKDKKSEQTENKRKHLANVAAAKAKRRAAPDLERAAPSKFEKPTILIVCEGENTEPSYFKKFKLTSATVKAVGEGFNTVSLVNRAIEMNRKGFYDQVWCVFDKDAFSAEDFNNAIVMAEANGFGVAYSNQAFEYWLILHFEDHQGGNMNRADYNKTINRYINTLGAVYDGDGSKIVSEDFFDILNGIEVNGKKSRMEIAMERAKKIYGRLSHTSPAAEESSTTVFKLVEEILKYI